MDRPHQTLSSLDELRQIQNEVRGCDSLHHLRRYFDRVQNVRRNHLDDFDVQLLVADVQEHIIERARALRDQPATAYLADKPTTRTSPVLVTSDKREDVTAEIPDEVPRLDNRTWQRAIYIALTLTVLICAAFFYLIQVARRINLPQTQSAAGTLQQNQTSGENTAANTTPTPAVSLTPTLRLYTDLIPGTVSIDNGPEQDLKDGELILDNLQPGAHSVKVNGHSGNAAFSFDVTGDAAPHVVGSPSASNAMTVLFSEQDGKGHVITNAERSVLSLDGKPAGEIGSEGLDVSELGKADHDLQVVQNRDRQRFVWTYTPAPVLTVYVKSDPNAGTVVVMAGQDDVTVSIDGKPYRRQTAEGQLRIPLRVGEYTLTAHKDGFIDPPPQTVEVKKAEESAVEFSLLPMAQVASLQVKGAMPATSVYIDRNYVALTGADGTVSIPNVKAGAHSVELRHDQAVPKRLDRVFQAGNSVVLTGADVQLDHVTPSEPVQQAAAPATIATESESAKAMNVDIPGEHVQRGGGFVPYHITRAPGRYSFAAQGRIGGFLKHSKLQWYAAYQDSENYVLFTLDGKHAIVREIRAGKSREISKTPFNAESNEWVQVDLSVKPDSISARAKGGDGGWDDLGSVSSDGRDFTQGKVGFYVPGNDEIAVANFRYYGH